MFKYFVEEFFVPMNLLHLTSSDPIQGVIYCKTKQNAFNFWEIHQMPKNVALISESRPRGLPPRIKLAVRPHSLLLTVERPRPTVWILAPRPPKHPSGFHRWKFHNFTPGPAWTIFYQHLQILPILLQFLLSLWRLFF